jgi:hypothetical protein
MLLYLELGVQRLWYVAKLPDGPWPQESAASLQVRLVSM